MITNNYNSRDLRVATYIKIMDFDRLCTFTNQLGKEQVKFVFPWQNDESVAGLPPVDETVKRYHEMMKEIHK